MQSKEIEEAAIKLAIKNAIDYGKADIGSVLSKVISRTKIDKSEIKDASEIVKKVVEEVNSKTKDELIAAYGPYKNEFSEYDKAKAQRTAKPKMELPGAKMGDFVTRFAPEPSGYMHIGHASAAFLAREFANVYKGKVGLYFDDTNAEKEKQEFVDAFKADLKWLGIEFDKEYYSSDNVDKMYEYAEQLIKQNDAYVCLCDGEKIKRLRMEGKGCEHKDHQPARSLELWRKMLYGTLEENAAILRLNSDMSSQNTAMRDPTLFRIRKHEHYRQGGKYIVWPTYDFNTPIMDSINGVTDAIRTKEYELRDELYYKLLDMLKLRKPRVHSHARISISGQVKGKREINQLIKDGVVEGYDDPRLVTIIALRRRGIMPQAIKEFVLRFGMSKVEASVSIDMLLAENRKIIDGIAKRLFFAESPVRLNISNAPKTHVKLKLHPSNDLGFREYEVGDSVYINGSDYESIKEGETIRLKELYNVKMTKKADEGHAEYVEGNGPTEKRIQWVEERGSVECVLHYIGDLMKDGKLNPESERKINGLAEGYVEKLDEGAIVQFERAGFFKLDNKEDFDFLSL